MIERAHKFTCDRCGAVACKVMDEHPHYCGFDLPRGWGESFAERRLIHGSQLICPDCARSLKGKKEASK